MHLETGQEIEGFSVITCEKLPEIDGYAYTLIHNKSKARLLYLQNDDPNKAFSISFKTPPVNDTGVFHILEHSVLCGSDKFPVKEPFVNLLKTSMQTFLNAMTFADKTMYPVASTNEQDLLNMMDVYLDAVFHPQIYHKRTIFEQEGWHYELTSVEGEDDTDADVSTNIDTNVGADAGADVDTNTNEPPKLCINGVVYNEMKGALSDASSVLYDELQSALFPDTAYRFESGGKPRAIPELTYEQFLEQHTRHYRLDNSYITLYGNLDICCMLAFLDKNYLSPVADEEHARDTERTEKGLEPLCPHALNKQAPVKALGIKKPMKTAPENACMGLGYVIGKVDERVRIVATDILLDAIMGSNVAPLKKRLLAEGLADDASAFLADAMLQPFAVIQLRGIKDDTSSHFKQVVDDELKKLAQGALDHELIEAALSHAEFVMREGDYGVADGVALSMAALSGWLYDDSLACAYIKYEDDFSYLRSVIDEGYFEQLINEVFLDNTHIAEVEIQAVETQEDYEAKRLGDLQETFTSADYERINAQVEKLRLVQVEPDSAEALATLPQLYVSDIEKDVAEETYSLVKDTPLPCLRHDISTRGIAYTYRYFNLADIDFEDLPYARTLALLLGKLNTTTHTAEEIDTLIQAKLGHFSAFTEIYGDPDMTEKVLAFFVVGASTLSENTTEALALANEIIYSTNFDDTQKIKDILVQKRVSMEMAFANAGHSAALARVASYYSPAALVKDKISGIEYYRFLKNTIDAFDECAQDLIAHLRDVAMRIFNADNLFMSFTGTDTDFEKFISSTTDAACVTNTTSATDAACGADTTNSQGAADAASTTSAAAPHDIDSTNTSLDHALRAYTTYPVPTVKNEAFIVASDVVYVALGYDRRLLGAAYSGVWPVIGRICSFDYLWNEVRVCGGAYGCGFQAARNGSLRFYSYRDPHLDETLERFKKAGSWLLDFKPTKAEMDGYVVSTVAALDAPVKPREKTRRQDRCFLSHIDENERLKLREEVIACTSADIRACAKTVTDASSNGYVCVFGNKEIIQSAKTPLQVIDLLSEV